MIRFSKTPWDTGAISKRRNMLTAVFITLMMVASVFGIFLSSQAKAQDSDASGCENYLIVGDTHGVGDKSAGLEDKLLSSGAKSVEFLVHNGRNTSEIADQLEGQNLDDTCVIIEGGTANSQDSKEDIDSDIKSVLDNASSAKHVFWVTPVVSDSKAGANWSTKKFNNSLNEAASGNDDLTIIDLQDMSLKDDLFRDNGVSMTDDGYNQRAEAIASGARVDPEESGDNSDDSSSDDSSGNGDGSGDSGNSDSGNSDNGNSNGGGGNSDGGSNSGNNDGTSNGGNREANRNEDCDTSECFNGDPSKASPKAIADSLNEVTDYGTASRYLAIQRWGAVNIAAPAYDFTDPASLPSALSSRAVGGLMGLGATAMTMTFTIIILAFTPDVTSFMTSIADYIFGNFIGGNILDEGSSNAGSTGVLVTSILTILILMSIIRAASTDTNMSLKQRAAGALSSIAKGAILLMLVMFMAAQSKKNHEGESEQTAQNTSDEAFEDIMDSDNDGNLPEGGGDTEYTGGAQGGQGGGSTNNINDPSSWHALSLGWIVSTAYYYGQMAGGAVSNIVGSFLITPIDFVTNSVENYTKNYDGYTACDRYTGAMHVAFNATGAVQTNANKSNVLTSLDNLYIGTFFNAYQTIYGGQTEAAGNSWCFVLERENGVRPAEWMMLSRTAGLYYEGIGQGNIIPTMDTSVHTTGEMSNVDPQAATTNGLKSSQGYLLKADGSWQSNNPAFNYPLRAATFMGGGNEAAAAEARYYMSACEWTPGDTYGHINDDWKYVRAMGKTGGDDSSGDDGADDYDASTEEESGVRGTAEGMVAEAFSKIEAEKGNHPTYYLSDLDCLHPQNFAIGHGEDSESIFGFGVKSLAAERWDYSPANPSLMESAQEKVKDVVSNVPLIGSGLKWGVEKATGDDGDGEAALHNDPKRKFNSATNEQGYNPAQAFWNWSNGYNANKGIVPAALVVLVVLVIICLVIVAAIPAMVINILFSILFVFIPVAMIGALLMIAIKGGKNK